MIIKRFELEKLASLNFSIHLLYGNNEGIKQDIISKIYTKNFKGEVLKYDEQDVLNNKEKKRELKSDLKKTGLFEIV